MSSASRREMGVGTKVGAFVLGLAVLFAAGLGLGRLVGPSEATAAGTGAHGEEQPHGHAPSPGASGVSEVLAGGLAVSSNGYTLRLGASTAPAGTDVPLTFRVEGPDGKPVMAYDVEHEQQLHLVLVRRDQTGYQHLHPALGSYGTWTTEADLTPGPWRVFADFTPTGGPATTLGADLSVAGDYAPAAPVTDVLTASVDGFEVTLTPPTSGLVAGREAELRLTVTRDGRPVTDLQPYLGAYGHLVALREGDLGYVHVHPQGAPGDGTTTPGPDVVFGTTLPTAGDYRLYLDFKHDGVVRTATFAVTAQGAAS